MICPCKLSVRILNKFQHVNNESTTATETTSTSAQNSSPPTAQPTQSAAAQVFATPELLEQIFLSVDDSKSLMRSRRVAPQWRAVIDDTSSLKKKMWLVPQQLDHEWYLSPGATHLRKRPRTTGAATDSSDIIYQSGIFNPFLLSIDPADIHHPIWKSGFHYSWISQPLFVRKQATTKSSLRKPPSKFLKMFATQPPVPVMYLRIRNGDNEARNYRCLVEKIQNSKGVRVGNVLRALSRMPKSQETMLLVEEMMFPSEQEVEISVSPYEGFPYAE